MKLPTALLLLALSLPSYGTTLPRIKVEELFQKADTVALVEIVQGITLGEGETTCGAKYTGHIIKLFKGKQQAQVEFGHFHGYEIGGKYILFLTNPGKIYHPMSSTNSMSMAVEAEFEKRCSSQLTASNVMHTGYGALHVTWSVPFEYKESVAVPSRYVVFPSSIKSLKADLGERHTFDDMVWIQENDVITYLSSLK